MYKNVSFAYPWMDSKEDCTDFNTEVAKSNKPSQADKDRFKADLDAINVDDKVICPRRADGSICSDIETVISTNNPTLRNMIFGGLTTPSASQQDQRLSDSQKIAQVIPKNSTISDIQSVAFEASATVDDVVAAKTAAIEAAAAKAAADSSAATAIPPVNS